MEIVLAAVVSAMVAGAVVMLLERTRRSQAPSRKPEPEREPEPERAPPPAAEAATAPIPAPAPAAAGREDAERELHERELELRARRTELARMEERMRAKERTLDVRAGELERAERSLEDRKRNLDNTAEELKHAKRDRQRELEQVSGLTRGQATKLLMAGAEEELRGEKARLARQVEEETKRDAERRARSILSTAVQRVAGGHAAETTVTLVELPADDFKGRIIGREGRNVRALESITGVDIILDETPSSVALSGFDGVRRAIAKLTLERLVQDGRINPTRIEQAFERAKREIDAHIDEVGEQALLDANVGPLHPELTKLIGRLHYRTSYSQNVLAHSVECAHLAELIAEELGADAKIARRAALLHDIGKAVSHEVQGSHALVGGQLARRFGEDEAVAHAMEAHHDEVEMRTVEAVIVQVADSVSGSRPGARHAESGERFVARMEELERIAGRRPGVESAHVLRAGRELRVIVRPEEVDDAGAALLSHEIARDLERESTHVTPGGTKVTVVRESRAVGQTR